MAVTRIKRFGDGELHVGGIISNPSGNLVLYCKSGSNVLIGRVTPTTYFSVGSTNYASVDIDYSNATTYPRLVAVGTCTEANATYAKLKVGGVIKRIKVWDDA